MRTRQKPDPKLKDQVYTLELYQKTLQPIGDNSNVIGSYFVSIRVAKSAYGPHIKRRTLYSYFKIEICWIFFFQEEDLLV